MLKIFLEIAEFCNMFKKIFYFLLFSFVLTQCKNKTVEYEIQYELQMIDTLQNRLGEVKTWLDKVDIEDYAERADIIENNYYYCDSYFRSHKIEVTKDISTMMDEYKGLMNIYKIVLNNHKNIVMETEELYIQLKTLKNSTKSKDYKKETFKQYFQKEKEDILKLHDMAKYVLTPAIVTENNFHRRQTEVEELMDSFKK